MSIKNKTLNSWEHLAVPAKIGFEMIGVSHTRGYQLIAERQIESYTDGRARKLVVESLKNYVAQRVAASQEPRQSPTAMATAARQARRAALSKS